MFEGIGAGARLVHRVAGRDLVRLRTSSEPLNAFAAPSATDANGTIEREPFMATSPAASTRITPDGRATAERRPVRRSTETKSAFKTTEMIAYVVATVGVLIAALVVDQADGGGLGAKQAWLYVTILTVGYMVSRGLAKSGSRDPYTEDGDR